MNGNVFLINRDSIVGIGGIWNTAGRVVSDNKVTRFYDSYSVAERDEPPSIDGLEGLSEMSGSIKWFDVGKGYGFIVPDDGGADILLHVTCLRRDGHQSAYEGARVVCEVTNGPKG